MSDIGHNSTLQGDAQKQLRAIVERIERLEEEKAALAGDIKEVYAEAKANGFDTKTLRVVVRLRKQDANERQEQEAILATYMHALGMLADTELGRAAISRRLKDAMSKLGTPVPLTDEEKAKGLMAAFDKDGTRMSISIPQSE